MDSKGLLLQSALFGYYADLLHYARNIVDKLEYDPYGGGCPWSPIGSGLKIILPENPTDIKEDGTMLARAYGFRFVEIIEGSVHADAQNGAKVADRCVNDMYWVLKAAFRQIEGNLEQLVLDLARDAVGVDGVAQLEAEFKERREQQLKLIAQEWNAAEERKKAALSEKTREEQEAEQKLSELEFAAHQAHRDWSTLKRISRDKPEGHPAHELAKEAEQTYRDRNEVAIDAHKDFQQKYREEQNVPVDSESDQTEATDSPDA